MYIKNIIEIHIQARKYFDKVNGNTYHSVKVLLIGNKGKSETLIAEPQYGYGEGWNQTALDLVRAKFKRAKSLHAKYSNGNKVYSYLTSWARDKKFQCNTDVQEFRRMKDLSF